VDRKGSATGILLWVTWVTFRPHEGLRTFGKIECCEVKFDKVGCRKVRCYVSWVQVRFSTDLNVVIFRFTHSVFERRESRVHLRRREELLKRNSWWAAISNEQCTYRHNENYYCTNYYRVSRHLSSIIAPHYEYLHITAARRGAVLCARWIDPTRPPIS